MDVQAEVSELLTKQMDAWNRNDLEGFMSAYLPSDSLTFLSAFGAIRGIEALRKRYQDRYQHAGAPLEKLSLEEIKIEPLGVDHAIAYGRYRVEESKKISTGVFSLVLARHQGVFKICFDHTTSIL